MLNFEHKGESDPVFLNIASLLLTGHLRVAYLHGNKAPSPFSPFLPIAHCADNKPPFTEHSTLLVASGEAARFPSCLLLIHIL